MVIGERYFWHEARGLTVRTWFKLHTVPRLRARVTETMYCTWCTRTFVRRTTGGHAQRFCRPDCRRAFDAAARRWVAKAIADGTLTLDELRDGPTATRALVSGVP